MNYVDLGLQSGTCWCDCNLGADFSADYGTMFNFADAQRQGVTLPTHRQILELKFFCKREWKTRNGINGCEFTGPNGKTIFMPACGRIDGTLQGRGVNGFYWTNETGGIRPGLAWNLMICDSWAEDGCADVQRCHAVRPVKMK